MKTQVTYYVNDYQAYDFEDALRAAKTCKYIPKVYVWIAGKGKKSLKVVRESSGFSFEPYKS